MAAAAGGQTVVHPSRMVLEVEAVERDHDFVVAYEEGRVAMIDAERWKTVLGIPDAVYGDSSVLQGEDSRRGP